MGIKWFKDLYTSLLNPNNLQALPSPASQSTETQQVSEQSNQTQAVSLQSTATQATSLQTSQSNTLQYKEPQTNSIQTQHVPLQPNSTQSTESQQRLLSPLQDNWEVNKPFQLPLNAVEAGYDNDGKIMYVGRVYHNGDYIPAKVFNVLNLAMFPYNGFELHVLNFEYLVGDKYKWVNGKPFPKGAVVVNPQSTGEHVYVGRGKYLDSLTCGKFVPSRNCLYIPFGLQEVPINDEFDILVHEDRYDDDSMEVMSQQ